MYRIYKCTVTFPRKVRRRGWSRLLSIVESCAPFAHLDDREMEDMPAFASEMDSIDGRSSEYADERDECRPRELRWVRESNGENVSAVAS